MWEIERSGGEILVNWGRLCAHPGGVVGSGGQALFGYLDLFSFYLTMYNIKKIIIFII